jgi:F0F1-type ATP synthase epsilon subunit
MKLGVYSLQRVLFRGEAREVNCHTKIGQITILDHHEPLISLLEKGVVKIIDENRQAHFIPITSGFLEIRSGNEARFLVEEAVSLEHI